MTSNYFFTFGSESVFCNLYIEVEIDAYNEQKWSKGHWTRRNATRMIARDIVYRILGSKWAFCYEAKQFAGQAEEHNLKRLCKIVDNWPATSYTEVG